LCYRAGIVLHEASGAAVDSLQALCTAADSGDFDALQALEADAEFAQTRLTYEYGTQIAHVAVDVETSSIELLHLVTVEDCGRVINPAIVHGQVLGASVQGLGGALLEEFQYDETGRMLSDSLTRYVMPTSLDFPKVEAFSVDFAPSRLNPLGAKGVGEGGIEGVGAAVANAVADALREVGVSIVALPLSKDNLSRLLREARHRRIATIEG
jgi:carbon-monoxide dehydrogenase large subunit